MSILNYIPGVAHVKALTHLICNDKEGAERTMETLHTKTPIVSHVAAGIAMLAGDDKRAKKCWDGGNSSLNALPVVGHVKGVGHYICLDIEGGNKAMVDATSTTLNMADGIPVVGHAKGVIHYVCGDVDGGNKAMKAATRTTAVMGAGAGGFLVGGPVGAVTTGVSAGAGWDTINASVTDWKEVNGLAKIIENPTSVDSYFDAGLSIVGDGMAGYAGGKIAKEVVRRVGNNAAGGNAGAAAAAGEAEAAAAQQLVDDLDAGKITYKEYQQKWNAMKPKGGFDNVPVKVNADQLQSYYDNGIITQTQYNQAKKEMAAAGGKNVTVNVPLNQAPTSAPGARGNQPPQNQAPAPAPGARGNQPPRNQAPAPAPGAGDNQPPQNQAPAPAPGAGDNQPPQNPIENRILDLEYILVLRQRLTELLNRIRRVIERDDGTQWRNPPRPFQRRSFHEMYEIVSELISNGHSVTIQNYEDRLLPLVIYSRHDEWREVIEYQVVDFLDVHDQLIDQQIPLEPAARGNLPPCPTVLSAEFQESEFQESELRLTRQRNHSGPGNFIYGIRCRIPDCRRRGPGNISYVGQTTRSVHERVCGEHARSVRDAITNNLYDAALLSMYRHAVNHRTHVPRGTPPRNVFREVMDVIILPTGGQDVRTEEELRSWECFWQFFFHCREFFWGWGQR